jgi:septal ring factor EnvC (AmiA/AmiB activator)
LTSFVFPRYDRPRAGDLPISRHADKATDRDEFERLERAVASLVEQHRVLRAENARLRRECEALERRAGALDEQVIEMHQRRQDVGKRIDELISQLDHLDAHFSAQRD